MTRKEIGELVGYSHTAVDNRLAESGKDGEKPDIHDT
nr:MAG TPA: putative transcription regulator [Caudoviricetes sp.]